MHPRPCPHRCLHRVSLALLGGLLCILVSGCGQTTSSAAPASTPAPPAAATPTVDPLTLNICATCDVQQRRMQATAAAGN